MLYLYYRGSDFLYVLCEATPSMRTFKLLKLMSHYKLRSFICIFCKKEFKAHDIKRKFCDSICFHKYNTGNNNPSKKPEVREKISKFHKGKHHSPNTEFKKGHTVPEEWRETFKAIKRGKGEESISWKGGKFKANNRWFIYQPDHIFCDHHGYVLQYRLIMEKHLGRYLKPEEVIHHINGNKDDDRLKNLKLFSNQREHIKEHLKSNGKLKSWQP